MHSRTSKEVLIYSLDLERLLIFYSSWGCCGFCSCYSCPLPPNCKTSEIPKKCFSTCLDHVFDRSAFFARSVRDEPNTPTKLSQSLQVRSTQLHTRRINHGLHDDCMYRSLEQLGAPHPPNRVEVPRISIFWTPQWACQLMLPQWWSSKSQFVNSNCEA